jgi:UDP-galactopyranose mutase
VISKVGKELYEKFFKGYTKKQWGLDPSELDASVAAEYQLAQIKMTGIYRYIPGDAFTWLHKDV